MTKKKNEKRKDKANDAARPYANASVVNGWTLLAHPALLSQLDALIAAAKAKNDPNSGPAKVLAWLKSALWMEIPADPSNRGYRLGKTLGPHLTHWHRDKYAGRFRLFFRFDSRAKIIVYAWVNDEDTLRTYGAKNDAYAVFKKRLDSDDPPDSWKELLADCGADEVIERFSALRR